MDITLSDTLGDLRETARKIDPQTPVGIEGTQMPSAWGGYDLWRLSQVLDWVEPYDIGTSREIFGSFMPGKPFMTTVFEKETNHARRRLWHLLLEGDRGCIVWWSEDCIDWKSQDYALTPKGQALAPVLKEMTSPLARIFLRAERERDPVYIVYSHPSIQVDWLIESIADRASWYRRFSSFEADHNVMARKRNGWLKLLQDAGYSPKFLNADSLENLVSATKGGVFVLSDARALSASQVQAVERALQNGATLLLDGPAGAFDHHGRMRAQLPAFSRSVGSRGVFAIRQNGGATTVETNISDIASFAKARQSGVVGEWHRWLEKVINPAQQAALEARMDSGKCIRAHRFSFRGARLYAFERNIDYHMSEDLKQAGGNEGLEKPVDFASKLAVGGHIYNLRTGAYLGNAKAVAGALNPWEPSFFAVFPAKVDGDPVEFLSR